MWIRILVTGIILIIFSSCEDSMILKSEKKMKKDLQGTWKKNFQGRFVFTKCDGDTIPYEEFWTFKDDVMYSTLEYNVPITCDRGTPDYKINDGVDTAIVSNFKIDTRILDAFLKFQVISGTQDSTVTLVDKWEFVTLDDDILYLATDDPKGNSVLQLEFHKVK